MNVLMIDNYDSFTYNVVHLLESLAGVEVTVRRNDEITLAEVEHFSKIVLSPGPGLPSEAGMMPEIVRHCGPHKSILGVCLGHQCIGEVFGATLHNLATPVHGKATPISVLDRSEPIFRNLPERFTVGRYHSWVVQRATLPADLVVTAVDDAGEVMALRHRYYDLCGVQFHPESILTEHGKAMLENWLHSSFEGIDQGAAPSKGALP